MNQSDDILFETRGRAGVVTLNKPQTLNAVTDPMLTALNARLNDWQKDDTVERVIIKATPGRAFSAGGDIRHLYERGVAKDYDFDFFAREYRLNARIAQFPKPYIALVDGIAMGGGVGVSFHGSHRIAGENISFAMPEVGIGFFPDVGASYFLSRLPGRLGLYLGLTGARMRQADALWSGLATHACPSKDFDALEEDLVGAEDIDSVLAHYAHKPPPGPVEQQQKDISQHFDKQSVADIMASLEVSQDTNDNDWAASTLATLKAKSPTSLEIAFQQITTGSSMDIAGCMKMEYRILERILRGVDFYEGIRAAIIDKDNAPVWQPATLDEIDPKDVEVHFETLGAEELKLP